MPATCQEDQDSAPGTEAGWAEICATRWLVQGEPWVESLGNVSPGVGAARRSRPWGSRLLIPSQEPAGVLSAVTGCSHNGPPPPYPGVARNLVSAAQRKALHPRRDSEDLAKLVCILRWGGARTSDTTTFQLKLVQPKGQLLSGTPRSLL